MHLIAASERRNIMDREPVKDWPDQCMAAANGPDSKKLMTLVAEIIKALNGRNRNAAP